MTYNLLFITLSILLLPFSIKAQLQTDTTELNPDQAVNLALKTHPFVQDSELNYEKLLTLKKTAVTLNPTSISGSFGRFNSFENDNLITIGQEFDSPWVYKAKAKLLQKEVEQGNLSMQKAKLEVKMLILNRFYESLLAQERLKIIQKLDSLYSNYNQSNELKYKHGEISNLENLNGNSKLLEIRNRLFIAQSQFDISVQNIKNLLQIAEPISLVADSLIYIPSFADTSQLQNHPIYQMAKQQVAVSESEVKLAYTAYLPKIGIGFNTQTLKGYYSDNGDDANTRYVGREQRFNFISAEIFLPLWFFSQQRKIQASKLEVAQANARFQQTSMELKQDIYEAYNLYKTYRKSYELYHNEGLKQSEQLIQLGLKSYYHGETGYLELNETLRTATLIKLEYLGIIEKLNQQAIYLDYLLEGINQ